jgi:HTH-type transcriptional regulator/antitoxin HipB
VETIRTKRHKRLIEILIAERKAAGIRQVQLAKKLKRSQTWIARIEMGGRRIDVVEFLDLAEAIGFNAPKLVEQLLKV